MLMRLIQETRGAHAHVMPRHGLLSQTRMDAGRSPHLSVTLDREHRLYVPETNRYRVQIYQET